MAEKCIVDPRYYTTDYYLDEADGGFEFKQNPFKLPKCFEQSIKTVRIKEEQSILDIGCGRGDVIYYLSTKVKKIVGVDYSEDSIRLTTKILSTLPSYLNSKIELYNMDINEILPKLGKFDIVFLLDVVEHMYPEQLEKMYNELFKHLNKGAEIIIHTPIADSEEEKHFFLPNTKQQIMHININTLEEHTKYIKDKMYVERLNKRLIKATLK